MNFPLKLGIEKTGLPLILTSGKTPNICFLIDTGSTHNILFNFVVEHFKEGFILLDEENKLIELEGNFKATPIVKATFNFEDIDYTSKFSVLDASEAVNHI